MSKMKAILATAALSAGLASAGAMAQDLKGPIPYPMPQPVATTKPILVPYDKLFHYGTLPAYHEPDWVSRVRQAGQAAAGRAAPAEGAADRRHVDDDATDPASMAERCAT